MSCNPTPTLTQFSTITSSSTSTSFTSSITTLPPQTSTITITSCLDATTSTSTGGTCTSSTLITSTTIIPGGTSTEQVPFVVTIPFTTTEAVQTLFAPCSPPPGSPTNNSTSGDNNPTPPPNSSSSTSEIVTTPTTTFTTSSDTTLPNGQVTQTQVTVTSTLPAQTMTTTVPLPTTQNNNGGHAASSNIGPIVGGAVGGFFGLIAIVVAVWFFFIRRRPSWEDIYEKEFGDDDLSGAGAVRRGRDRSNLLDDEDDPIPGSTEPKPYQYGLVGAAASRPLSENAGVTSPSPHPTLSASGHGRRSSETPLMLNVQPGTPSSSVGQRGQPRTPNTGSTSRPSTGGSYSGWPGAAPSVSDHGGQMLTPVAAVRAQSPPTGQVQPPPPGAGYAMRSTSPGPNPLMGVAINSGPALSLGTTFTSSTSDQRTAPEMDEPESPSSVMAPQRKLFVTNQADTTMSPPGSPRSPQTSPMASSNHGAGPSSFAGAMSSAPPLPPPASYGPYPSAAEEKRAALARNASAISTATSAPSMYSQASAPRSAHNALLMNGINNYMSGGSSAGAGGSGSGGTAGPHSPLSPPSARTAEHSELAYLGGPEEYQQPQRPQRPPPRSAKRPTSAGVITHTDGGPANASSSSIDAPPAYAE